jgi:hypothetical protein
MLPFARRAALLVSFPLVLASPATAADEPPPPMAQAPPPAAGDLPPLPEGVTALQFGEIFVKPVGPRGLVFTDKAKSLAGRRVRILGHMVRREGAPPGTLLLAPYPVQLHDSEYGLADDLPPNTLFVTVPDAEGEIPFTAGLLLLTGRLEIGSREEPDGRTSVVRLVLDPKTQGQGAAPGPKAVNP